MHHSPVELSATGVVMVANSIEGFEKGLGLDSFMKVKSISDY